MDYELLEEYYLQELKISLVVLSLPGERQIEVTGVGCVGDDMLLDFDHFYQSVKEEYINNNLLSNHQIKLLDQFSEYLLEFNTIDDADFFWNKEMICTHPKWEELRNKSKHLLEELFDEKYDMEVSTKTQIVNGHRLDTTDRTLITL